MGRIRLLLFDIDGTLIDHDKAMASGIAALRLAPEAPLWMRGRRFADLFRLSCDEVYRDYLGWGRVPIEAQRDLLRSFDRSLSVECCDTLYQRFRGGYSAGVAVCGDVPGLLFHLRGYMRMGVLAQGHPPTEREKLRRVGIDGLLDTVDILAGGWEDPSVVNDILRRFDVPFEEIAFVSSDLSRSVLPLSANIAKALCLNRRASGEYATARMIRSLDDLPPILFEGAMEFCPPAR